VYRGTSSAYQQFWLAQGATTIAPGAGVLEQIVQRSGDGSSLVRTPKNTLESFLPSGLLGSRNFADGVAHSLQYSTTTTPAAVAPLPGLLISVSDSFGRSLQLTYDTAGRLATMTSSVGHLYQYTLDSVAMWSKFDIRWCHSTVSLQRRHLYIWSRLAKGAHRDR